MASNDIGDWYKSIPQITRYWFTGSVVLPLMGKIGLVTPMSMVLLFEKIVYSFHVSILFILKPFTNIRIYTVDRLRSLGRCIKTFGVPTILNTFKNE